MTISELEFILAMLKSRAPNAPIKILGYQSRETGTGVLSDMHFAELSSDGHTLINLDFDPLQATQAPLHGLVIYDQGIAKELHLLGAD